MDDSATAETLNGGAGMAVTEGDPAKLTILRTKQRRIRPRQRDTRVALTIARCRGHMHRQSIASLSEAGLLH